MQDTSRFPILLDPRYELLGELGSGGMGIVYKARDRETGDLVALKILKPEVAAEPASLERFKNELRLARKITHKNVCRIYEFLRTERTSYISMEYIEGESLRSSLRREGRMNVEEGLRIARQICSGLAEAHLQGIVHRDLKPANVMIDREGNAKVMDFGIARSADIDVTATGIVTGTPAYLSPEQVEGKNMDVRSDIYSLGLILYEMFTGKAAFTGDSAISVALKHLHEIPEPPRSIEPRLPPSLENAILRCLRKDPAERFQSIGELVAALVGAPMPEVSSLATDRRLLPRLTSGRVWQWGGAALVAALLALWYFAPSFRVPMDIQFREFTLANGARVILSEDHAAPTFTLLVVYDVGSRNDKPGQSGFAHFFEHLMFKGSENVANGEHSYLVRKNGGVPNGSTFADLTMLWNVLPANQLDMALFLEADRMRSLAIDQSVLDTERGVVLEELRSSYQNRPYGRAELALRETIFDTFAYRHATVGSEEDVRAARLPEVMEFFNSYFGPNNAAIVLVGDFRTEDTLAKVRKYFEEIPSRPVPSGTVLEEKPQTSERRRTVEDPFARTPYLHIAFKLPPRNTPGWQSIQLACDMLARGSSSRLYQKLVKEKEAAASVFYAVDDRRAASIAAFNIAIRPGKDIGEVERMFHEEVARLQTDSASTEELEKVKLQSRRARAQRNQSTLNRAYEFGTDALNFKDPAFSRRAVEEIRGMTPEKIMLAARNYLQPSNRTVITTIPAASPSPATPAAESPSIRPAQEIPPARVPWKNRAPISDEILQVKLPEPSELVLENGLKVLHVEDRRLPVVVVQLKVAGAGPLYDPPGQEGLAEIAAQMLTEGTRTRTSQEIAETVDGFGAIISSMGTARSTDCFMYASGLSENFERWMEVFADLAIHPAFPTDELNNLKQRVKVRLRQRDSASSSLGTEIFQRLVFGNHRAAGAPSAQSIDSIRPDLLSQWHRERYAPQNSILGIAGDISSSDAKRIVKRVFSAWPKSEFRAEPLSFPVPVSSRRIQIVDRPGSVQTSILVGNIAVDRRDPDHLPVVVANAVLGWGPGSRLFTILREEMGLAYTTGSTFTASEYPGPWRSEATVRAEASGAALRQILTEIRKLCAERAGADELRDARRAAAASFVLPLEQLSQILSLVILRETYGFSADYWESYPAKLTAVGAEEVQRVACKYLGVEGLQIVAVGDASRIANLVAEFGPIEIVK